MLFDRAKCQKNQSRLQGTLRAAVETGTIIAVCNKLPAPVFAVVKSGVLHQDDYFKKLA
jgi:hypothetical protein